MSNCHETVKPLIIKHNLPKLVLVGNPNVGKSVFFNALTGMYVDVSNFPGTTVDISRGTYKGYIVEDTPGVYGVSSFNDEERVARDIIINADIILNVVDAVHLQRDLFLTQQLLDMGKKVIIAVNMMDEAAKNGVKIDIEKMSELLGVIAIPTKALKGEGIELIKQQLADARNGNRTEGILELIEPYTSKDIYEPEALLILEDDPNILERNNLKEVGLREEIYIKRRARVDNIVEQVVSESSEGIRFSTKLGRMMLRPITGVPILILTLLASFIFIGVFIAQIVVGITEEQLMVGLYQPLVIGFFNRWLPLDSFLGQVLIGEFGLLTMTPIYIIGLLLPLVISFYFLLSIMEDSGYLPRIAVLTDRLFTSIGLNGKAIIPIILGFGCITMATMTTRMLGTKRERIIATVLLGLTIPCSAQLGVIIGLLTPLGALYSIIYAIVLILIFGLVGKLLNKLLPGQSSDLIIDLPPVRLPVLRNIVKKTYLKSKMFMLEAVPLFALGALIISLMQYTGFLTVIKDWMAPFVQWWLMLPKEVATVFIMGIIRRDFGAAGLSSLVLSNNQMLVALVTLTLFVPCIASIMIIFKERTKTEALIIWLGSFTVAFLTGGLLSRVLMLL